MGGVVAVAVLVGLPGFGGVVAVAVTVGCCGSTYVPNKANSVKWLATIVTTLFAVSTPQPAQGSISIQAEPFPKANFNDAGSWTLAAASIASV